MLERFYAASSEKAVLSTVGEAIENAAGCLQLCGGQESGIEAAIHAMQTAYDQNDVEGVLFADASNAFNSLNRQVCLQNIRHLCPEIAPAFINTYRSPAALYVDGEAIMSVEGTTQGDPLAMAMYALGTIPLIRVAAESDAVQSWYADDANAAGKIPRLRAWSDIIDWRGPEFGYHLNAAKSATDTLEPPLDHPSIGPLLLWRR